MTEPIKQDRITRNRVAAYLVAAFIQQVFA